MMMMMMSSKCLEAFPETHIHPRHLMTAQNLNHNPRSIPLWLYIVNKKGWWMLTPCQMMGLL